LVESVVGVDITTTTGAVVVVVVVVVMSSSRLCDCRYSLLMSQQLSVSYIADKSLSTAAQLNNNDAILHHGCADVELLKFIYTHFFGNSPTGQTCLRIFELDGSNDTE